MNSVRHSFGDAESTTATGSNVFALLKKMPVPATTFIYMATGKHDEFDFILPQHQRFIDQLKKQRVPYQYTEFEGGHFDGKVLAACLPSLLTKAIETLN